jgi:DNA-3-methyladenine glycosylase
LNGDPLATRPEPLGPPLSAEYFGQPTLAVACGLLGALLVHERPDGRRVGRVVETEAYVGPDDRASHASRGRTPRTWPMFGPPGHAYVYLIYGVHHCLNVVTENPIGYPAAVLIRALEAVEGLPGPARGPGLVCRLMDIDRRFNDADVTVPPLYFVAGTPIPEDRVACGPRVGVDYAGEWADKPWRFWVSDSPAVSRPNPFRARSSGRVNRLRR